MKKMMTLIAVMAMTTLAVQANETIDAISNAVTDVVEVVSPTSEAAVQENETNDSKIEEKAPEKDS